MTMTMVFPSAPPRITSSTQCLIHIDGARNLILLFSMSHAPLHDGCRVVDRDSPGLRQGIARELRKQQSILQREIAEKVSRHAK
jgi:hypothetical protein